LFNLRQVSQSISQIVNDSCSVSALIFLVFHEVELCFDSLLLSNEVPDCVLLYLETQDHVVEASQLTAV